MAYDELSNEKKSLRLTEEEALALLNMCLFTQAAETTVNGDALRKVGGLCREFIREQELTRPIKHKTCLERVKIPLSRVTRMSRRNHDVNTATLA